LVNPPADEPVRRVQAALDRFASGLQVTRLPQTARTAREAANALGCELDCIVKSLVFRGRETGKPYLVEIGGSRRVDPERLAQAAGEAVEISTPDFVLEQTGFPVGGVAPVGLQRPIKTFVDELLLTHAELWASAGNERAVFRLTPAQLIELTGGLKARLHAG
jgi:prolyl-tRNA editing enzyme YbaK/EbsC (Cys-tRNA(Pro) deacylase)